MLMPAYNTAAVTAVGGAQPSAVVTTTDSSTSSGSKDTYWTKLFVGGLPYHTTDATLRDHFKVYGDIEEAVVITDRQTGKSRGYGFVIMSDRASAERACKEPNPIIDGRKANVNLAILGAKPRGNAAVAAAFPFTAVRAAGYPSLLAGNYGLQPMFQPAAAAYQPAMLSGNSLATALATQFYDYQPVGLGSHHQFAQPQAHFAQNAAAFDPYANYIAAAQAQQAQAQAQAAAAAAAAANSPYAYLQGAGGATANGVLSPYAHAQTESRIQ